MIVTVCTVFGPTFVSEAMTEITCLHINNMPEVGTICSAEEAGLVYKQTHGAVYSLGGSGNVNHQADLSIWVNWRLMRTPRRSSESTPRTVHRTELKMMRILKVEVLETKSCMTALCRVHAA